MAWQRISHWAVANRPIGELRAAYRRTDLIAVDLDECLFPGYTQKELGSGAPIRGLPEHPITP